jgi:predicted nucleotidyltransferase
MTPASVALDAVRTVLAQHPHIVAAYLFGSTARGVADPSDLDIAVMFAEAVDGFREALTLHVELEKQVAFPVDIHDFDSLPSDFQFRVLHEGDVLIDRDHGARLRRHVKAQNEYFDFKPYLDRIRAGAMRRAMAAADG